MSELRLLTGAELAAIRADVAWEREKGDIGSWQSRDLSRLLSHIDALTERQAVLEEALALCGVSFDWDAIVAVRRQMRAYDAARGEEAGR